MLVRSALLFARSVAPLAGQTNAFLIYPERNGSAATYVTRGAGGTNQSELCTEVPGDLVAGVGDDGAACLAFGYRFTVVDENPSTPEQFDIVFRSPDANGQPGTEIARIGPLSSGTLPTATRTTVQVTVAFSTPVSLPCQGTWFHGVDLYPATTWPTSDGLGMFCAYYYPPVARLVGDNPRAGAPNLAWQVVGGVPSPVAQSMTFWMGPLVRSAVLSAGGVDPTNVFHTPNGSPNYGAGGLYPDVSGLPRTDGISVLIEDSWRFGASAFVLMGLGLSPFGGIQFPGFGGRLWLDPTVLITFGPVTVGGAGAAIPLLAPGSIPPSAVGVRLHYQGVVLGGTTGGAVLTNVSGVIF